MAKNKIDSQKCINWRIFVILFVLVWIIYSNTFHASFHLDDFQNITENEQIHIENLYPSTIFNSVFNHSFDNLLFYRPIPNITLAVNWYFGKDDVTGYHAVNIAIHLFTAFFLYLAIFNLFNTPKLTDRYMGDKRFIALLAATLWAANPIHTQAVTYIVQRMAAMAALFYIIGIFFYLKARLCNSLKKKIVLFSGFLIAFLMAVGSKENAVILPVSILLIEIIFFQSIFDFKTIKKLLFLGWLLVLVISLMGFILFLKGDFVSHVLDIYETRNFTLFERLITEPRVVVFYLSQIFYPIADRLSIDHDIVLSTSFFSPWSTLPAIFFIIFSTMIAFWQINKSPLFSFAVLFFFVNHIIESSIIPLELVFEHRNYLPSLFLFLPIAAGLKWLIDYYSKEIMGGVLIGFVIVLISMLGMGTYIRNLAWIDEKTLWEDTIEKAPGRARGYQNLAATYYASINNYDKILELSEKAMYLEDNTRYKAEVLSLANMANVYAKHKKNYEKVIQIYNRILSINPENFSAKYHLTLALIQTEQLEEAIKYVDQLLSEHPESINYLNTKAFILLKQEEPEEAIKYLTKTIKIDPDNEKTLLNLGVAKSMIKKYRSAQQYLKRIPDKSENIILAKFLFIETFLKAGDKHRAEIYAEKLASRFSPANIQNSLKQLNIGGLQWPVATDLISLIIADKLVGQSTKIMELGKTDGG